MIISRGITRVKAQISGCGDSKSLVMTSDPGSNPAVSAGWPLCPHVLEGVSGNG